jgi:hypothetical protein
LATGLDRDDGGDLREKERRERKAARQRFQSVLPKLCG